MVTLIFEHNDININNERNATERKLNHCSELCRIMSENITAGGSVERHRMPETELSFFSGYQTEGFQLVRIKPL